MLRSIKYTHAVDARLMISGPCENHPKGIHRRTDEYEYASSLGRTV